MVTTIQISEDLKTQLASRKMSRKDSYEEVIWDLLEDTMELSEHALKKIEQAQKDINQGRTHTLKEVKKRLQL